MAPKAESGDRGGTATVPDKRTTTQTVRVKPGLRYALSRLRVLRCAAHGYVGKGIRGKIGYTENRISTRKMIASILLLAVVALLIVAGANYVNNVNILREERRQHAAKTGQLKADKDRAVAHVQTQARVIKQIMDTLHTAALDLPTDYELRQSVSMLTMLLARLTVPPDLAAPFLATLKKPEYELPKLERLLKGLGNASIDELWQAGSFNDLLSILELLVREAKAQADVRAAAQKAVPEEEPEPAPPKQSSGGLYVR